MRNKILLILGLAFFATATFLVARNFRTNQIPNGTDKSCANCHNNPAGGGPRNAFGQEVEANHLSTPGSAGNVMWGPALASHDSDGDGFSNGVELQDPTGAWQIGQPFPGDPSLVTNPGDPTDFPNTTAVEMLPGIAAAYALEANYPNPFNPSTTIRYELPESGNVLLEVYNSLGERVRVLTDQYSEAGMYSTTWNGRDESGRLTDSGTYLYRLSANGFSSTRRMVMLK
jgi:hypothetical protein